MADELVATFNGPFDSFSINLSLQNTSGGSIRSFGISGRTAKFPVTWDTIGSASGPATVLSTDGLDTEVVTIRFSNFDDGETVDFSGIDPDFTGSSSSGVRVLDIEGARAMVFFDDGTSAFAEFEATDEETLMAVLTK